MAAAGDCACIIVIASPAYLRSEWCGRERDAFRQNGAVLTVRDKGPLWIVFPRDDYPELNDPRVDLQWVWQLRAIEIR